MFFSLAICGSWSHSGDQNSRFHAQIFWPCSHHLDNWTTRRSQHGVPVWLSIRQMGRGELSSLSSVIFSWRSFYQLLYTLQWIYDNDPRGLTEFHYMISYSDAGQFRKRNHSSRNHAACSRYWVLLEEWLVYRYHIPEDSCTSQWAQYADVWTFSLESCCLLITLPQSWSQYGRRHALQATIFLYISDAKVSALKSEALAWRFTGDPTDVQSTFDRIDMLYKFHGRASGVPHGQVTLDFRQLI